ncbi:hypothetical protein K440DRAFT_39627 [Wilcoxina mikolae CBS 423.85]|nr:hypothetical protein K440DRAFT_39627 [Wilcoxina mikolae CBS 423.85]
MVRLKNIECHISTASGRLEEYTDPNDAGDREGNSPCSIVYVKSEEGQLFSVVLNLLDDVGIAPAGDSIVGVLAFDGEVNPDTLLVYPRRTCVRARSVSATESGGFVERQFLFSKLHVTEDGPKAKDSEGIDILALGEIRLTVVRYRTNGLTRKNSGDRGQAYSKDTKTLHEKQLKGRDLAHSVGLSAPQPTSAPNRVCGMYIDTDDNPYLTFKFRYRSERALKGLGLIQRTPLPSLSPEPGLNSHRSSSAVLQMSRKELEAEVIRLRNKPDGIAEVKKENQKKVKRECADSGPSNIKKRKRPLTIDLTGDSD